MSLRHHRHHMLDRFDSSLERGFLFADPRLYERLSDENAEFRGQEALVEEKKWYEFLLYLDLLEFLGLHVVLDLEIDYSPSSSFQCLAWVFWEELFLHERSGSLDVPECIESCDEDSREEEAEQDKLGIHKGRSSRSLYFECSGSLSPHHMWDTMSILAIFDAHSPSLIYIGLISIRID